MKHLREILVYAAILMAFPAISDDRPVLHTNSVHGIDILVRGISTNLGSRIGWTAPVVFDGEPDLTEYRLYINGVKALGWPADEARPASTNVTQEADVDVDLYRVGATNLLWMTAVNETTAESAPSDGLEIVWTIPRRPPSLQIVQVPDGVALRVLNIPTGTKRIDVDISEDLDLWLGGASVAYFRSESDE